MHMCPLDFFLSQAWEDADVHRWRFLSLFSVSSFHLGLWKALCCFWCCCHTNLAWQLGCSSLPDDYFCISFLACTSFEQCCAPRFCPWPTWYSKIISLFLSFTTFYFIMSKFLCPVYSGFSLKTVLSCSLDIHPHNVSPTRFIHCPFFSPNMSSIVFAAPAISSWLSQSPGSFFSRLPHRSSRHLNRHQALLRASVCCIFLRLPHDNPTAWGSPEFSSPGWVSSKHNE